MEKLLALYFYVMVINGGGLGVMFLFTSLVARTRYNV